MTVLDANVLIAHFSDLDPHHERAVTLLLDADDELAVHPLTLAEVLVGPARAGMLERARSLLDRLGVIVRPTPPDEPETLARLRAETQLKMPDCCVLAAALDSADTLATFDEKLATAAERLGVVVRRG